MKLVFVHGWSVTSLETYGALPQVLEKVGKENGLDLDIQNIYLSEYISFHDEVTLKDIARAFESARKDKLKDEPFACITHSTGGPAIRLWIDLFFKNDLETTPLSHLIMLAPANHGSSLALLGKERLGRIKAWVQGIEPGVGVLNWLQLGSKGQWELNNSWLDYTYKQDTFFPFVLCGETIDKHFYDFLNPYLVEKGSDGVIRLTGANLNYKTIHLKQDCKNTPFDAIVDGHTIKAYPLHLDGDINSSKECAFEVIPKSSHTGKKYGIMASITKRKNVKPVVYSIIDSLKVENLEQYKQLTETMKQKNTKLQKERFIMFIFRVKDNYGNEIKDYDMFLLAGKQYKPGDLPKNFFVDKQKNNLSGHLTYYLNYDKLKEIKDGKIGIRIVARPDEGFSHYAPAEFRSKDLDIKEFIQPNQSVMVEITLKRWISTNTFILDKIGEGKESFKKRKPNDEFVE